MRRAGSTEECDCLPLLTHTAQCSPAAQKAWWTRAEPPDQPYIPTWLTPTARCSPPPSLLQKGSKSKHLTPLDTNPQKHEMELHTPSFLPLRGFLIVTAFFPSSHDQSHPLLSTTIFPSNPGIAS